MRFSPFALTTLGAAALSVTLGLTALAGSTNPPADHPVPAGAAGLGCAVDITPERGLLRVDAILKADADITGHYDLQVTRPGTSLRQGGPFSLDAGETETLGQITLNGPASTLDVELTLTVAGRSYTCPTGL